LHRSTTLVTTKSALAPFWPPGFPSLLTVNGSNSAYYLFVRC
jgi:hypothetical protein